MFYLWGKLRLEISWPWNWITTATMGQIWCCGYSQLYYNACNIYVVRKNTRPKFRLYKVFPKWDENCRTRLWKFSANMVHAILNICGRLPKHKCQVCIPHGYYKFGRNRMNTVVGVAFNRTNEIWALLIWLSSSKYVSINYNYYNYYSP